VKLKGVKVLLTLGKVLKWFGWVLIVLAALIILIGYIGIWVMQGFGELQRTMSPFNLWNFFAVIFTFAPGLFFKWC